VPASNGITGTLPFSSIREQKKFLLLVFPHYFGVKFSPLMKNHPGTWVITLNGSKQLWGLVLTATFPQNSIQNAE
jgi:hypothetical protein